jgi:hypothetical protein
MRDNTELLGYVQVQVGSRLFALPVQAVRPATGQGELFEEAGQLGIRVDGDASPADVQSQIESASAQAVRELSKRHLN